LLQLQEEAKCCKLQDDGQVSPLNLGMIAAYYYVQYRTIELIESSVTQKAKIRGILEILSAAWEFANLPIRFGEEKTLKIMARTLTHKLPEDAAFDSNTKALILLQSHFSRTPLSANLRADQKTVLLDSVNLIQAIVDVISSNGWLKPALAAMELSQMIVQYVSAATADFEQIVNRCLTGLFCLSCFSCRGLWNKDNHLKQVSSL
jgi:pre-mRNA-splicing helicase BRR2